jgi:nitrate/TMAO reductase-like tetraheme cytochrome c subunit
MTTRSRIVLAAFVALTCQPAQAWSQEDSATCDKCHEDRRFLTGKTATSDQDQALFITGAMLAQSAHDELTCASCHDQHAAGYPHATDAIAVACSACHEAEQNEWAQSVHAANYTSTGDAADCVGCHTSHTVYPKDDERSATYDLNVAGLCAGCHADSVIVGTYFSSAEDSLSAAAVALYHETVHGTRVTESGLVVSATCSDCHSAHRTLPGDSIASTLHGDSVATTCGRCHEEVLALYDGAAHGAASYNGAGEHLDGPPPNCVDCHTAHGIVGAHEPNWFRGTVEECGECHERLYQTYLGTYHGKVTSLGGELAAKCSDCHTAHDMRPETDSLSSVHASNLVATCAKCHENASESFARYYVHGDPANRAEFPLLFWPLVIVTAYVVGALALFNVHTGMWLWRNARHAIRKRREGQS